MGKDSGSGVGWREREGERRIKVVGWVRYFALFLSLLSAAAD